MTTPNGEQKPKESAGEKDGAAETEKEAEASGNVLIKTSIRDNCEANQCENLQVENLFNAKVLIIMEESSSPLGIYPASEGGTLVELPSDSEQTTYYSVRQTQDRQNPSLQPWFVENTEYTPDCTGTIKAGVNKTCTIINNLSTKDSTIAHLSVVNRISNDCEPKRICSSLRSDELFSNHIFTFLSRTGEPYKEEVTFPGSENGWMVEIFPESNQIPIQYDVKQTMGDKDDFVPRFSPWNVTYSDDCHGRLVGGEINICTITSVFSEGKQSEAKLKVITKTHNIGSVCKPVQISCLDFQPDQFFDVSVYTLKDNTYEKELTVPASDFGWVVDLVPDSNEDSVQYYVKQNMAQDTYKLLSQELIPTVSYSQQCSGMINRGESAVCTIDNYLTSGKQANMKQAEYDAS